MVDLGDSGIPTMSNGVARCERWRPTLAGLLAVVTAAAAILILGIVATSAQTQETVTFSGTISSDDGPLNAMKVSIFCFGCPDGSHTDPDGDPARPWPVGWLGGSKLLWEGTTDTLGNWSASITVPSEGRPTVIAWDPDRDYGFAYGSVWSWTETTGVETHMSEGGFLSGRILSDGRPPSSAEVRYTLGDDPLYAGSGLGLIVGPDGSYSTPGLPNGHVYLSQADLPRPYVANSPALLGEISDGQDAVADHELIQYGSVSGRVTDGSGRGLGGIIVSFSTAPGGYYYEGTTPPVSQTAIVTDNSGAYGSLHFRPWVFSFYFRDPTGTYAPVTRDGVQVASKEAVDLSVQMALASRISGRVSDRQGIPVPSARVSVCLPRDDNELECDPWRGPRAASTDTGTYQVGGLEPGTYQIRVTVYQTSTEEYSGPIVVTEGSSHQADFVIGGGRVSGVVTDIAGTPLADISVGFRSTTGPSPWDSIRTGRDGSYLSPLLAAGEYALSFPGFSFSMDPVSVTDGMTTSDVDVSLDAGYVEGRVTSGGEPLPDATVTYSGRARGTVLTAPDGTYQIAAPAGAYRIAFSTPWHEQASHPDSIQVVGGSTTTGIDVDLTERPGTGSPARPPGGTKVDGATSTPGGVPNFSGTETMVIEHRGCPGGYAQLLVGRRSRMQETPEGSGRYVISVPIADIGRVGLVDVSIAVSGCEDPDENADVAFNIYIDPSGIVQDQNGNPVAGATVTLMRDNPDTITPDFEVVADGSVLMDPSVNNTNPDVTGSDGRFRWDVVAGLWKVRAEAPGCHTPGDGSTPFVETSELVVPPPRLGLVLELDCADAADGSFTDVSGVHGPSVSALRADGVLEGTGCSPGRFCPREDMKRWTMAVWLVRVLDGSDPGPITTTRFADVDPQQWWAPYVERLAELEVTAGCKTEPLRYCPDASVRRGQMATFLVRAFELADAGAAGFVDASGGVHAANIDALAAANITAGCATDPLRYCPDASVRRGQMATFLARALGLVAIS